MPYIQIFIYFPELLVTISLFLLGRICACDLFSFKDFGWLAGWLVGQLVGWLVGWSFSWLVGFGFELTQYCVRTNVVGLGVL